MSLFGFTPLLYSETQQVAVFIPMGEQATDSVVGRGAESQAGASPEAFAAVVAEHYDRVLAFARSFTEDDALAADVAQQVFLKLLSDLEQFRREGELSSWLYRLAVNACVDHHRRNSKFVGLEEAEAILRRGQAAVQEDGVARREIRSEVRRAISGLDSRLRLPILLRHVAGLSYEAVGRVLGIPTGTAASRIYRAHRALEKQLRRFRGALDRG